MKFFKKTDLIIIFVLLIISVCGLFLYKKVFSEKQCFANIYYESDLVKTIDLSKKEDYIFSLQQNEHVLIQVFSDGSIAFKESDCPDKICIKSGKLRMVGESAACLPNKIVIKIVSGEKHNNNDVDLIVGK